LSTAGEASLTALVLRQSRYLDRPECYSEKTELWKKTRGGKSSFTNRRHVLIRPKVSSVLVCLCVPALLLLSPLLSTAAAAAEHFSVKEYNEFHDVLHPLVHEALPGKDFQRIRSNAGEFVRRGKALVRVGVPKGTAATNVEEFRKELRKFKSALDRFSKDARVGTDAQLETSFSEVHDSFEMLVGMLPRK
jgi:hypothetical protein